ncbi:unnamed protein product [Staurois parvus]|uniref:Uncharacterized protein n=1 Tax=Staurois parvus TaxID=386267 RepID=A0ABN9HK05_9NEOB|nr:unnamed protein product [Staurois parvus]
MSCPPPPPQIVNSVVQGPLIPTVLNCIVIVLSTLMLYSAT